MCVCVRARAGWGYCVWQDTSKQSAVVAFGQWDSEQFSLFSLAELLIIVDLLSSERNKKVIFALENKEGMGDNVLGSGTQSKPHHPLCQSRHCWF